MTIFGRKLGVVYQFELARMLKKRSFWASILLFPLMFALIAVVIIYAQKNSEDAASEVRRAKFSVIYVDDSGEVNPAVAQKLGAKSATNVAHAENLVRAGKVDAFFHFPADLARDKIAISAQNAGIFANPKYAALAQNMVRISAAMNVSTGAEAALAGRLTTALTTFDHGKKYDPLAAMIAPGIFLVLFYLVIVMFGSQMMAATTEEKENRVTEMILTTIKTRTLIAGKVFAFLSLVLIQVALILVLIVAAYLALRSRLDLPNFDLAHLPLDPTRILVGFAIFAGSILLFSGLLVMIGAALPTAREAQQYMAIPLLLIFAPLYLAPMFLSSTSNFVVSALTFFPFTAPIPLMIRNAAGNLPLATAAIATAILFATAGVVMALAAKMFAFGAVEYHRKLSLKNMFSR